MTRRGAILASGIALAAALGSQALLAVRVPAWERDSALLTPPPSPETLAVQALGDREFIFRLHALRLQHVGNLGGAVVPLSNLDYATLVAWFRTLDTLNLRSPTIPVAATYLFGGAQEKRDVTRIVTYLEARAERGGPKAWRWLANAVLLSQYRLEDRSRALALARRLTDYPGENVPPWARQLQAFVLADMGREREARALVQRLLESLDDLTPAERRWMQAFANRRLIPQPDGREP